MNKNLWYMIITSKNSLVEPIFFAPYTTPYFCSTRSSMELIRLVGFSTVKKAAKFAV